MSSDLARQYVETRFLANWTAFPVHLGGMEYAIDPITNEPVTNLVDGWVEVEVADTSVEQASLGRTKAIRRHRGVVLITVATKLGSGSAQARRYADTVASYYRSQQDGEMTYYEPDIRHIGKRNGWFLMGVSVPYHLDLIV